MTTKMPLAEAIAVLSYGGHKLAKRAWAQIESDIRRAAAEALLDRDMVRWVGRKLHPTVPAFVAAQAVWNEHTAQYGGTHRIVRGSRLVEVARLVDGTTHLGITIKSAMSTAVLSDDERRELIEALGGRA